jgi:O-antigen/teichoic acid export membrane protein
MWERVTRDASILALGALILVPLQLGYRLLALTSLDAEAYGRAALLLSIFQAALLIGHFSLHIPASRLAARVPADGRRSLAAGLLRASVGPGAVAAAGMALITFLVLASVEQAALAAVGMAALAFASIGAGFLRGVGRVWTAAAVLPFNGVVQLLVLGVLVANGDSGTGQVLAAYYVGNIAAAALVVALLAPGLRRASTSTVEPEARPFSLLRAAGYLTIAAAAVGAVTVAPRAILATHSYAQVAILDVALLAYTLWQRVTGSVFSAVVPARASVQDPGRKLFIPGLGTAAVVTALAGVVAVALATTPWLEDAFVAVGLGEYSEAVPVGAVLLLAAPAELFLSITAGAIAGAGLDRTLAAICIGALVAQLVLFALVRGDDPVTYAAGVVLAYWAMYLASRPFLARANVHERTFLPARTAVGGVAE